MMIMIKISLFMIMITTEKAACRGRSNIRMYFVLTELEDVSSFSSQLDKNDNDQDKNIGFP